MNRNLITIFLFTTLFSFTLAVNGNDQFSPATVEESFDEASGNFVAPFVEEPSEAYLQLEKLTQNGKADVKSIWRELENISYPNRDFMKEALFANNNALTKAALYNMNIDLALALEQFAQRLDIPKYYELVHLRYNWAEEIRKKYGKPPTAGRRRVMKSYKGYQ